LISTEDPEKSSKAQEEITAEYTGDGLTIGYNAEYLKDVINHVDGQKVVINLNTPISAALFNSEDVDENVDSTMLLMPIRLND
jgi:DNA polymerase-3 subunit beta